MTQSAKSRRNDITWYRETLARTDLDLGADRVRYQQELARLEAEEKAHTR